MTLTARRSAHSHRAEVVVGAGGRSLVVAGMNLGLAGESGPRGSLLDLLLGLLLLVALIEVVAGEHHGPGGLAVTLASCV